MTDYSGWTDEQVNEAIFKAKGWVALPPPAVPMWQRPTKSDVDSRFWYFSFPPDYTHDWRLCGELLEEFDKWRSAGVFFDPRGKWQSFFVEIPDQGYSWFEADTPQRAICEAWLAWKEQG